MINYYSIIFKYNKLCCLLVSDICSFDIYISPEIMTFKSINMDVNKIFCENR